MNFSFLTILAAASAQPILDLVIPDEIGFLDNFRAPVADVMSTLPKIGDVIPNIEGVLPDIMPIDGIFDVDLTGRAEELFNRLISIRPDSIEEIRDIFNSFPDVFNPQDLLHLFDVEDVDALVEKIRAARDAGIGRFDEVRVQFGEFMTSFVDLTHDQIEEFASSVDELIDAQQARIADLREMVANFREGNEEDAQEIFDVLFDLREFNTFKLGDVQESLKSIIEGQVDSLENAVVSIQKLLPDLRVIMTSFIDRVEGIREAGLMSAEELFKVVEMFTYSPLLLGDDISTILFESLEGVTTRLDDVFIRTAKLLPEFAEVLPKLREILLNEELLSIPEFFQIIPLLRDDRGFELMAIFEDVIGSRDIEGILARLAELRLDISIESAPPAMLESLLGRFRSFIPL